MELKPFKKPDAKAMHSWFDDTATHEWLGKASWADNIFRLQAEPPGAEHRGQRRVAFYAFIGYVDVQPVGFVAASIVDRFLKYGGEKEGKPLYSDIEMQITAAISFLVNPAWRKSGYGTAMIKALAGRPEVDQVKIFEARVDPSNTASSKTLEKAGFISDYRADFENMIYFIYRKKKVSI